MWRMLFEKGIETLFDINGGVCDKVKNFGKIDHKEFRILGGNKSELFKNQDKLIHDLAPILRNLQRHFLEGN